MTQSPQTGEVHALFEHALAQPRERRAAFLDQACAGRVVLRERIEQLLRLADDGEGFLDRGALRQERAAIESDSAYAAGRTIGAYRLVRPLGRGGMAEVWLCERREGGFQQLAALKLIPHALGSIGQRFVGEREILAALAHPGIARLYDGGVEADGTAYMVMEYVEGEHLIAYANAHRLPLSERLNLFLQICDAVAYAHTRLVVHRDLKPSNVLVTSDGQAKLLDFGIAKLLDAEPAKDATRTLYLSPAYAAPEQLSGGQIGTATDVYELGVMLFELLTDRLPWSDDAAPMAAAVKRLLDAPLPPPSRLATEQSPVPKRSLQGDLDAIAGKALRREANERYPDARALADDVRRHLDRQPVQARAGARAYVARRFVRRNWLPLSSAALLFVAMAAATVAVAWQADKARMQALRAEAVQGFMVDLFKTNSSRQKDPIKARQTSVRELLDIGAARIEKSLGAAPENKLTLLRVFSDLYEELALSDSQIPLMQQTVALSRSLYGENSSELAGDRIQLASVLWIRGKKRTEAEALLQEATSALDGRGDWTSELRGRLHLARAGFFLTGDERRTYEEAGAAITVLSKHSPSEDLARAFYYKSLTARSVHRDEESMENLQEAIRVSRSVSGDRDPMLSTYYFNLMQIQKLAWDLDAAEASARQALELALADTAEVAFDAARALTGIVTIQVRSGRLKEGLESARQAKEWLARPNGGAGDPVLSANVLRTLAFALGAIGELDDGLAQALAAVKILRETSADTHLAISLDIAAGRLVDLGRLPEASAALEEARTLWERAAGAVDDSHVLWLIRAALDRDDLAQARALLAGYPVSGTTAREIAVSSFKRALLEAEIELQSGDAGKSAQLAAAVGDQARSNELARYLRPLISDSELLEGRARLRGGDAATARPLLERALATRIDLYLPKSPKIAEAELALAECALSEGKRAEAAERVAKAEAIEKQHSSLSNRYVEPLQKLRARLAQR